MISQGQTITVLLVGGMRGPACRQAVVEALESVPGVADVDVNLFRARASVIHDPNCGPDDLIRAVAKLGYSASIEAMRQRGVM